MAGQSRAGRAEQADKQVGEQAVMHSGWAGKAVKQTGKANPPG
jgi:hypothetical protein